MLASCLAFGVLRTSLHRLQGGTPVVGKLADYFLRYRENKNRTKIVVTSVPECGGRMLGGNPKRRMQVKEVGLLSGLFRRMRGRR